MTDNHGYVLAPLPVAPVNETDIVLLPKGLKALKQVAKEVDLDLRGAYVNLDGDFDSSPRSRGEVEPHDFYWKERPARGCDCITL